MNASAHVRRAETALWFAAFLVGYGLAYRFGLAFGHRSPSPFWIPDAVLLAALLRSPPRTWWAFVVATLPIRFMLGFSAVPLWFILGSFAIDGARCVVDAAILRRVLANPVRFGNLREFAMFAVLVGFVMPALWAFAGAGLLVLRGYPFEPSWTLWFLGDAVAQFVLTPLILYWVFDPAWLRRPLDPKRTIEAVIVFAAIMVTSCIAAHTGAGSGYYSEQRFYAPAPFMLWAAIRFGMPGATGSAGVLTLFFVLAAVGARGPFAGRAPGDVALALQNFLLLRAITLLIVGVVVEQRRRMEDALRESEARFRNMANEAPVLLWMAGTDNLNTFFNKGWLDFTGRTMEQEMGNGWADSVHPEDLPHCTESYESALKAGESFEVEYRLKRHDGEYRWMLGIGAPRYEPDGTVAGYIGSVIDITERRREEEMRQVLAHTQRLAAMGELTAAIAHEVRQPMTAILLDAQTAEKVASNKDPSPDLLREIASGIRINAARVDTVMSRILSYLRKQDPQPKPLDMNVVVQGVLQLVAGDAMRRSVQIKPELGRNLPPIVADRTQLEQVLLNLVVNGMDAMENVAETARQITVSTAMSADGNIEVTVSDCGVGIAPDKLPMLFDSFFTTRKNGMGLGLSIAKSIVVAHHGRIWAENNGSSGASFHVALPVSNDARARAG